MAVALTSPKRVIPTCSLCSRLLPRCNERRVLHSSATSGVWSVLKEASAKLYSVKTIGTFWCSLSSEYPIAYWLPRLRLPELRVWSTQPFQKFPSARPAGFSHALFQLSRDTLTILQISLDCQKLLQEKRKPVLSDQTVYVASVFSLSPRTRNIRLARETTTFPLHGRFSKSCSLWILPFMGEILWVRIPMLRHLP